ncbi:hypothetical protein EG835_06190 [bacterium]|nr:hypothetical protein [bacterium]
MAECQHLEGCLFFNDLLSGMPSTAKMVKSQYCCGPRADNRWCARRMVLDKRGRDAVPDNLFPSDLPRARKMLRD